MDTLLQKKGWTIFDFFRFGSLAGCVDLFLRPISFAIDCSRDTTYHTNAMMFSSRGSLSISCPPAIPMHPDGLPIQRLLLLLAVLQKRLGYDMNSREVRIHDIPDVSWPVMLNRLVRWGGRARGFGESAPEFQMVGIKTALSGEKIFPSPWWNKQVLIKTFSQVYLNIVGGLRVQETAADLAVALAIVSSYATIPVRSVSLF